MIALSTVGQDMANALPQAMLRLINNVGRCPHLSAHTACAEAFDLFLATLSA